MEDYKIFEKEEFSCLTQKQKEILMALPQNLKGKTSVEAAGIIMRTISLLEAEGKLTAQQAVKILKGESNPENMPIEYLKDAKLSLNQDIIRKLGIKVPEDLEESSKWILFFPHVRKD